MSQPYESSFMKALAAFEHTLPTNMDLELDIVHTDSTSCNVTIAPGTLLEGEWTVNIPDYSIEYGDEAKWVTFYYDSENEAST